MNAADAAEITSVPLAGRLVALEPLSPEHGDGLQSELFKLEAEVDVVLAALQALRE